MRMRRKQNIDNFGSLDLSSTTRKPVRRKKRNCRMVLFMIPFIFVIIMLVWQICAREDAKAQLVGEIANIEQMTLQKQIEREAEEEAKAREEQALAEKKMELQQLFDEVGDFSALSYEQAYEISSKIAGEYARYRIGEEAKQLAWDLVTTRSNKEKRAYIQEFKDNISGLKEEHEVAAGVNFSSSVYEGAQEYADYLLRVFR